MISIPKSILVTGATGQLGQLVINALLARVPAAAIIAGVRSCEGEAAGRLSQKGVTLRIADYDRPETLAPALAGVDRLLLVSSNAVGSRLVQHARVINAAAQAGVGLLAYTSILHADTSPLPLAGEHRPTEEAIMASGIPFVLLRNGWYTENYGFWVKRALADGAVYGCAGEGRIAAAARADYAEAAAVVLATDGHAGRIYELAGDPPFTMREFSSAVAKASGREVVYHDLSEAEFREALTAAKVAPPMAGMFAAIDHGIANGALDDDSHQLSQLLGRPTTPYQETIRKIVG